MGRQVICQADARRIPLADGSVHCCVTSPPYYGLRLYDGVGDSGIGLETTLEEYIANIVATFREVARVLRDDATCWVNLGDSFGSGTRASRDYSKTTKHGYWNNPGINLRNPSPAKQLLGIPWRVAFALQADGWYLRSDIIWHKPNPMPEPVTDRPTKSHEYLFLLSKSPRYFYDAQAIAEPSMNAGRVLDYTGEQKNNDADPKMQAPRPRGREIVVGATRNRRDVWTIPTSPYKGAHFATFPPKLVEPCVLAGTSARGVCPECGAPWERVVARSGGTIGKGWHDHTDDAATEQRLIDQDASRGRNGREPYRVETTGWRPTCDHGADWRVIETPTGERSGEDPTMETGRAGMNRPRGPNEGRRSMYVWEQRGYAAQLRNSPHRPAMEQEAGSAFDHYIRTDESGARPLPPDLLERWLESGWITQPDEPAAPPEPEPAVVLDPFCGSGTVGQVCRENGRRFVGLDLSWKYLHELAYARAELGQLALA